MKNLNLLCDIDTPTYLIFSSSVPDFVYYSHIPVFILSVFVVIFMLRAKNRSVPHWILIWTIIPFLAWVILDSIFWASNRGDVIMFVWSAIILIEPMIYAGIFLLHYYFVYGKFPGLKYILPIGILFTPLFLLVSTKLTLESFDVTSCLAVEGFISLYYTYIVEFLFIVLIVANLLLALKSFEKNKKREIIYLSIGILFFLVIFTAGNMLGSFTSNWQIGQLGLLGMPIFLGALAYSIVEFQTFRMRILAPQVLVVSIWFLLLSTLFISEITNARFIIGSTLVLFTIIGYALIKSIKLEVLHREEIQRLATKLEKANVRLKQIDKLKSEFVSIASHQLRSPITAISGYASLMRQGTYGEISAKMKVPVDRIERSARMMAESIDDYLNVSRIESGNMKYNSYDMNLIDEAEHICDDLRSEALKLGLILLFKKKTDSRGIIHADLGKVQQIIHNLLNNSIKYTPKGVITVYVHDDLKAKKIFVDIVDTGIGMNTETINTIFQKFERGDSAATVNVKGTGLGLYVALKMTEAMGGDITAHSEGEGKGSRFTIEMPLVM